MAKCKIEGLSEYSQQLNALYNDSGTIVKRCLYEGAAVMADSIKSSIGSIPTRGDNEYGHEGYILKGITSAQKQGLEDSFGISPMSDRDNVQSVKCGFDGYNSVVTKQYPKGQPNQLIARAIESGTSFLQACHFMSKAINSSKATVEDRMNTVCDEELLKRTTGGI